MVQSPSHLSGHVLLSYAGCHGVLVEDLEATIQSKLNLLSIEQQVFGVFGQPFDFMWLVKVPAQDCQCAVIARGVVLILTVQRLYGEVRVWQPPALANCH